MTSIAVSLTMWLVQKDELLTVVQVWVQIPVGYKSHLSWLRLQFIFGGCVFFFFFQIVGHVDKTQNVSMARRPVNRYLWLEN